MKILVAADKFKGSLGSREACAAIARGLHVAFPEAEIVQCPIADGGEGTMELISAILGAKVVEVGVTGPLGDPVTARYGVSGGRAIMEMSAASGLLLVPEDRRDPWVASTIGTGEMIGDALRRGVEELIIGIGGSATNDGGRGMAEALGFRFSKDPVGGRLRISAPAVKPAARARFQVACDVSNPLLGDRGCTRVYGPQKGVGAADFGAHEQRLAELAEAVHLDLAEVPVDTAGAGAAGGLGFGLMAFCGAELRSGFDLVASMSGLQAAIDGADLIVTGEGGMDAQTLMGKGPAGVAGMARSGGKRVVALCGVARDLEALSGRFDQVISLESLINTREESMSRASELLEKSAAGVRI
ncbi:MAG: glycerate kinase [Verrucomicrobiales bacterium]